MLYMYIFDASMYMCIYEYIFINYMHLCIYLYICAFMNIYFFYTIIVVCWGASEVTFEHMNKHLYEHLYEYLYEHN